VLAIKQGRVIFDNIRKFVIFLLSCNLSELFVIASAAILNLHFQLFPLQILFINLVTDVLPALALGVTEAAPHIMERKPYSSGIPIIDKKRWVALFVYSSVIALSTIGAVFTSHFWLHNGEGWNPELCNNVLFYTLIFSQILHVFNMSTERAIAFFKTEVFRNRYVWYAAIACALMALSAYWIEPVRRVLEITIYGWRDWSIIITFSLLSLFANQLLKRFNVIV
jgi:P-type Ca2+ transporter type 2C